jgi:hypothetical protein
MLMQKWEYCSVNYTGPTTESWITFYRPEGPLVVNLERDKSKGDKRNGDAWQRCLAELGRDGWEVVNFEDFVQRFKRPLP